MSSSRKRTSVVDENKIMNDSLVNNLVSQLADSNAAFRWRHLPFLTSRWTTEPTIMRIVSSAAP